MRLLSEDGTSKLLSSNLQLTKTPDWHNNGINWTHSWDMLDAVVYNPDATEQAAFGITGAARVHSVPDRGPGNKPLVRDDGHHAPLFAPGKPALPGPAYIPKSHRFRDRPACHFDLMVSSAISSYAMLTPTQDDQNTADWFNAPTGITAPYWFAMVCRPKGTGGIADAPWDCVGNETHAGPTVIAGNSSVLGGGTNWTFSCWDDKGSGIRPYNVVTTGVVASPDTSVLLIMSVQSGASLSQMWVYSRNSRNRLVSNQGLPLGTLDANTLHEMYFGWVHSFYMTNAGIVDDAIGLLDLSTLISWAEQVLPITETIAAEP